MKPNWWQAAFFAASAFITWGLTHHEKPDKLNFYPLAGHIYTNVKIYADNPNTEDRDTFRVAPRLQIGRVEKADSKAVEIMLTDGEEEIVARNEIDKLHLYVYANDPSLPGYLRHEQEH